MNRALIYFATSSFLLMFAVLSSCQNTNNKIFDNQVVPLNIFYKKNLYEVERQWVTLKEDKLKIQLSVFIHMPVLTDSTVKREILPIKDWQVKHFDATSTKVGSQIANKASKGIYDGAVNGKSINKKFPILIFGPGLGWLSTDYYNILLPLVRQGIIVACISATPISKTVYFPEGQYNIVNKTEVDYTRNAEYLSFATNELLKLAQENNSILFSKIDTEKVIAGGHSISGASALLAANTNKNIKAIINLDGDVNEEFTNIRPLQSILYITSQPPGVSDTTVDAWLDDRSEKRRDNSYINNSSLAHNSFRIKVPNMYHLDFLDISMLKDSIEQKFRRNRFGLIRPELANAIVVNAINLFVETNFENKNDWDNFKLNYKNIYLNIKK
ncbi:hypothetical protein [Flavihumibacter sp. UBA7668]|uniref:hypothetical protein n=1 Tax=Flavihumibacter sp. UBA7668 TaxID=1946542 RepID=UPI0025C01BDA|nr:hypothetical protein [Flavihumibacter sp. UBA7668]